MSTIVAHAHPFVIGVDTHAGTHTYAILAADGNHLGTEAFPNTAAGRSRAIAWVGRRTGGDIDALWVIEGAGSYGRSWPATPPIPVTAWLRQPG